MKRTIQAAAKLAGVSVRTLHYYDGIGLLHPSETTEAGYRLYDDTDLERLMQILFFRELDFPLQEIGALLDNPSFDRTKALHRHRELLLLKQQRLERLVGLIDRNLEGENEMNKSQFEPFDMSEIERAQKEYAEEAANRWGSTEEYAESSKKTAGYAKEDWARIQKEMDGIWGRLAACMSGPAEALEAQQAVAEWQAHITRNYYTCSIEILRGLGEMYPADERFRKSLDTSYGEGVAQFASEAIRIFCK